MRLKSFLTWEETENFRKEDRELGSPFVFSLILKVNYGESIGYEMTLFPSSVFLSIVPYQNQMCGRVLGNIFQFRDFLFIFGKGNVGRKWSSNFSKTMKSLFMSLNLFRDSLRAFLKLERENGRLGLCRKWENKFRGTDMTGPRLNGKEKSGVSMLSMRA